ncbi:MAG: DUF4345 family protein [Pseudomonadota bacterium]
MTDVLNITLAVLTIGFGAFGWLAPRFTASVLDLKPGQTTMGLSELRASVGCLFVVTAAAALFLDDPMAWVMLGIVYAGAAAGRLTSCLLDRPTTTKAWIYFGVEAVMAAPLILLNLPLRA